MTPPDPHLPQPKPNETTLETTFDAYTAAHAAITAATAELNDLYVQLEDAHKAMHKAQTALAGCDPAYGEDHRQLYVRDANEAFRYAAYIQAKDGQARARLAKAQAAARSAFAGATDHYVCVIERNAAKTG